MAGIVLKTIFFHELPQLVRPEPYIGMGWVGTITGVALARRFGFAFIAPLLLGGVAYTVGGLIDQLGWTVVVPGVVHPHELFHLAVLMGAFIHWLFVWKIVEGIACGTREPRPCRTIEASLTSTCRRAAWARMCCRFSRRAGLVSTPLRNKGSEYRRRKIQSVTADVMHLIELLDRLRGERFWLLDSCLFRGLL